jgi:Large polyvalent protein associated domain 25
MFYIMFLKSETKEVPTFQKISFQEACEKTHELEHQYRQQGKRDSIDFHVLNEENQELYAGTYQVGSRFAVNLLDHIKKQLSQMELNPKQEAIRQSFLKKLYHEVPYRLHPEAMEFPEKEEAESKLTSGTSSKGGYTSRLSHLHRKMLYGGSALCVLLLSIGCWTTVSASQQQSDEVVQLQQKLKEEEKLTKLYEIALLGDIEKALQQLSKEKGKQGSKVQQEVYVGLLLEEKKYKEAVKIGGEMKVEDQLLEKGDVQQVKTFQELFPSSTGTFDVAYLEQRWDDVLSQKEVRMTEKRERMKGYAFLRTGKVEKAKKQVNHLQDERIHQKIKQYEQVQQKIKDLQKQIEEEQQKDPKNEGKIQSLTEEKQKKERTLSSI